MTLLELIELLKKRLALVIALPVAFGLISAVYCFLFMPNEYTATTSMYVLSTHTGDTANVASSDLSASQMIANDVAKLFTSDRITRETLEATGLDSLSEYDVSVESSTTTRVITLRVTGPDPRNAAGIANTMADRVSDIAREVMGIEAVNVLDAAQIPTSPSGPRRFMYVAVACMAGLFTAVAIVVLADTLDTRVRSADEISDLLGTPVIGRFPAMRKGR
ncbi:lipopolysaccharide biosynthesis protein [Coriobacteriales bacterium OH1046]|nr:lipopolysaccharide biosynthesis protein [Coriobacteriales bacterium OH1046]